MSWYKDWFNSEKYLKVYSHRNDTEAEKLVDLILNNINIGPNSKILDMACGSGRHAISFAKRGYDVTAVDISERLISNAKSIAEQNNVSIDFILSDILDFHSPKQFNISLNLFTSIGYFDSDEENFQVILKAYELLAEGGYFIIDYFNKSYLLRNLIPTTIFSENGDRIIQNRSIKGDRVVKNITIESSGTVEEFYESVRLYSYKEMITYFKSAGFSIIKEFGDYDGNKFSSDSSPRLIIFGKK